MGYNRTTTLTNLLERANAERQQLKAQIVRLKVQVAAWESAVQTARLNNPYSLDAFTPVSAEDWQRLNNLVQRELGHGLDRYSAACMVQAWDGCTATIETMATEAIEAAE